MNYNNINTLIFDLGGVILNLDLDGAFQRFSSMMTGEIKDLKSAYEQHPFIRSYELGLIDDDQFISEFQKMLGNSISRAEALDLWCSMLLDIPRPRIDWILKLKEQYQVVLLSNTNAIHIGQVNRMLQQTTEFAKLDDLFHKVFYSYEIHERKPDAAIYDFVLNDLNIPAVASVMFDDARENLSTAKSLGIGTVYVEQNQLTIEHLPNGRA